MGTSRPRSMAILLVLLVVAAFFPCLGNDFVNWDDDKNFLENPSYRGLGWAQIRWDWTSFHIGVYQPLAWMILGAQYLALRTEALGIPPHQSDPLCPRYRRPVRVHPLPAGTLSGQDASAEDPRLRRSPPAWRWRCSPSIRCGPRSWPGLRASRIYPAPCSACWRSWPISGRSRRAERRAGAGWWARSPSSWRRSCPRRWR